MAKDTNDLMNTDEEFHSAKSLVVNTDTHTQRDSFFLWPRETDFNSANDGFVIPVTETHIKTYYMIQSKWHHIKLLDYRLNFWKKRIVRVK